MKPRLAMFVSSALLATLGTTSAQAAQSAQTAQPQDAATLGEIVATAQRHQQNLLSVPLSIQAQTGDPLAKAGIQDLTSLQFNTPGNPPATNSGSAAGWAPTRRPPAQTVEEVQT